MTHPTYRALLLLLGLSTLSACAEVETGTVSPCHGQFRAEGKYFAEGEAPDGRRIVVSAKNSPAIGCAD